MRCNNKRERGGESLLASNDFYNKYNDNGFRIERNSYLDDTLYLVEIYKYDDSGNDIEIFQSNSDGESGKETYKYDDKGNPIEENRYYLVDSLERSFKDTYKYDYGEKNNWIKWIHFSNNIPKHIIEREIEYYY